MGSATASSARLPNNKQGDKHNVSTQTVTESIQEIKTIQARIGKKQEAILEHLIRNDSLKDPLEKSGGQWTMIARERQAIADLWKRQLGLRHAIAQANEATVITINGVTRTMAEWLLWRREIAPVHQQQLITFVGKIRGVRDMNNRNSRLYSSQELAKAKPEDWVVNLDEAALTAEIESLESLLGSLDGQLSLKNATVLVTVPD